MPNSLDLMNCNSPGFSVHGDSPGKNTGVGCHILIQGIFLPRDQTLTSCGSYIAVRFFTTGPTRVKLEFPLTSLIYGVIHKWTTHTKHSNCTHLPTDSHRPTCIWLGTIRYCNHGPRDTITPLCTTSSGCSPKSTSQSISVAAGGQHVSLQ